MGRWVMEWEGTSGKGDDRHGQSQAVADFGAGPGWSIWRGGWRNPESSRGLAPCYLTTLQGCREAGMMGVWPAGLYSQEKALHRVEAYCHYLVAIPGWYHRPHNL